MEYAKIATTTIRHLSNQITKSSDREVVAIMLVTSIGFAILLLACATIGVTIGVMI